MDTLETEEIHRAIGHFVYEFSRLEDWLRVTLQHLLKIDPDAFSVVSAGLDFAFFCNASKALLKEDSTLVSDAPAHSKAYRTVPRSERTPKAGCPWGMDRRHGNSYRAKLACGWRIFRTTRRIA